MWRKLQHKDPAAFPHRADKGMSTLESLTQTFPLTDPKVPVRAEACSFIIPEGWCPRQPPHLHMLRSASIAVCYYITLRYTLHDTLQ